MLICTHPLTPSCMILAGYPFVNGEDLVDLIKTATLDNRLWPMLTYVRKALYSCADQPPTLNDFPMARRERVMAF